MYIMTAILETHVTGAKAELFVMLRARVVFFIHGMAVLVQEAWADHFNPSLVTVVVHHCVGVGMWSFQTFCFLIPFGRAC